MDDAETTDPASSFGMFGKAPSPHVLGRYLADLTEADAKVLLALIAHAGNTGAIAYPSRAILAQLTGMAPRSIVRALRRLEASGAVQRLSKGQGRGITTRYRIVLTGTGENGDPGVTLSDEKGDPAVTLSGENSDSTVTLLDENSDPPVTFSGEKGDPARPKRGLPGHPKRIEETKETTPPLTPPATDLAESATDGARGEGADSSVPSTRNELVAAVGAAWREATGARLSAADAETITAEAGNGSAELLGQITAETIIAADRWRREGTRKFNVLNLKVVLMYLREKLLARAQRDRHTEALAAPACRRGRDSQANAQAAEARQAAQHEQAAAKMAHFNGLPEADRQAYLATARTKRPTATSKEFIEAVAVTAAWAEYENTTDVVNA